MFRLMIRTLFFNNETTAFIRGYFNGRKRLRRVIPGDGLLRGSSSVNCRFVGTRNEGDRNRRTGVALSQMVNGRRSLERAVDRAERRI